VRLRATAPVRLVGPLHVVGSPWSAAEPKQCRQGYRASQRAWQSATCLRRSFSVCYLARTRRSSRVRCLVSMFARSRGCPCFKKANCYPHLWITVCVTTEELPRAR
jgi:hypothetical protein